MIDIDALLGIQSSPQQEARRRSLPIPLDGTPRHTRRAIKRTMRNLKKAENAAKALGGLPDIGESWHCLMTGDYDGFDLIDAVLEHAAPADCERLHMATLGFAERNAVRLLELMNAGRVKLATMIVSQWYEADAAEAHVVARLAKELPARGGWYLATRSHAKLALFGLTDGRRFVIESSANLRTCRSIEQFCLTQDAGLFEFYATWMETIRRNELARTT